MPDGLRSFAVWRDPVERFKSVFKYLALSGGNQNRPTKPSPSMDAWLDWTEIELKKPILEQDEHIRKQSDYYKVEDVEVVVPLSQLTEWFVKQGFGELPHEHARKTPVRLTLAQAARIRRIYWQDYIRIGSLMPSWQDRPLITGLWIADELPPIARLCILSFLHHGFRFKLHTYGEVVGVPEGVEIVDANSILASSEIHHDHSTALTASTVGLIRDRYLSRNGGFWIDLDIICLDPGKFPDDWPWFAMDDSGTVGTVALGFPAGHPVMLDLERLAEDPACPMLWDDKATLERKSKLQTRFPEVQTRRQQVELNSIDFDNFSEAVKHYGLLNRAASPPSFQPVMPIKWKNFFDASLSLGSPELREAWAIKLWHEKRLDCTDTLRDMERNSLVADLMHLHGCAPDYLGEKTQKPCSTPRILIGVCSCVPHGDKREAVRATWASRPPAEIDIRFFIGGADPQNEPDVIGLPANDSYQHLPAKVMAFFRYALEHFDFDWLFKCDDDTYVDLTRLPELIGDSVDLIGNNFLNFRNGPSGGAGYFLSRDLVQQIVTKVDIPDTGSEDVLIGEAAVELGAVTCSSDRLIFNNAHFPRPENDIVTSHWCSPARLHAIHTIRHSLPTGEVLAKHPHWEDKILLYENGVFVKKSSDCAGTFRKEVLRGF